MIGNNANNVLKGRQGNDILFSAGGGGDILTGGKGRDSFLIDSGMGSFVTVTDFSRKNDLLIFDVDFESLSYKREKEDTEFLVNGNLVARLLKVREFSLEHHALFTGFDDLLG